jgi:phage shock protein C
VNGRARRLYRDRENGVLMGVCAGIANHFAVRPLVVRVLAVFALLLQFVPTVLVYVIAGLLLKDRPLTWSGRRPEHEFWRDSNESWR